MRKYLLHVLIISFVFLLAPTAQVATCVDEQISNEVSSGGVIGNILKK